MAINEGFATDGEGRRIYFPPVGQPRLVPSREVEAKFNEVLSFLFFGAVLVGLVGIPLSIYRDWQLSIVGSEGVLLAFGVRAVAASTFARRWPLVADRRITYARFVVGVLRWKGRGRLIFLLLLCLLGIAGMIAFVSWALVTLYSRGAALNVYEHSKQIVLILIMLGMVCYGWVWVSRIAAALRTSPVRA